MNPIISEIERQRLAEMDENERALAERISPAETKLTSDDIALLRPFIYWCEKNNVRHCPAKPATIAVWIAAHEFKAEPVESLGAIERLHDRYGVSNPVATAIVRQVLEPLVRVPAPRSWPQNDKHQFVKLPPELRQCVANREAARERELRRLQNERAAERKAIKEKENAESERPSAVADNAGAGPA